MTVAIWPTDLPRPMRSGFQSQLDDPRMRKQSETGPPGYRRRFSSVARSVGMTIDVARWQKAVFDNFYEIQMSHGSLPFWMPDPLTDGWAMLTETGAPILTETGAPLLLSAQWLCLFGGSTPAETIKGVRFRIAFTISVLP